MTTYMHTDEYYGIVPKDLFVPCELRHDKYLITVTTSLLLNEFRLNSSKNLDIRTTLFWYFHVLKIIITIENSEIKLKRPWQAKVRPWKVVRKLKNKMRQEYQGDRIYLQNSSSWVLETTTQEGEHIGLEMDTSRLTAWTQNVRLICYISREFPSKTWTLHCDKLKTILVL